MQDPLTPIDEDDPRPLRYSFWKGAVILSGSVTPRVIGDVLLFGVLSLGIVLLTLGAKQWLDVELALSVGPFEAAGAVLGLLLVLRTNAGYDRWWEARKLWGGIVNQSRNLATGGLAYGPKDGIWRNRFVRWSAAFCHVVRHSLRGERTMPEVERLLGPAETRRIQSHEHMPGFVAEQLAQMLREGVDKGMSEMSFLQLETQRAKLVDHLGGCERIKKTPLARSSAIQVRRFILLFLVTFPLALMGKFQNEALAFQIGSLVVPSQVWLVPLFVMLMAYPLLSLDRIGMELQNPFDVRRLDHLPLDRICTTIEHNLLDLLAEDDSQGIEEMGEIAPVPKKSAQKPSTSDTYIS